MIKLFVTGDIHIGKKYDRYPEVKDQLIRSRFDCLKRCVEQAEKEHCDFFVITGDLFDNISAIRQSDVNKVVEILTAFDGRVVVLPGNHDYYTGGEKVWSDFENARGRLSHNIILITEFRELTFDVGEETVTFYPAFCQSKHAPENNLGWINEVDMDASTYHIGLAHGAIEGLSPDMKNEYFLMTEKELNSIPVDLWLIGHTHIPWPAGIGQERDAVGYKIFNPGTPEQTDLSNNTEGVCFVVSLERTSKGVTTAAHSFPSGAIRYFDKSVKVQDTGLQAAIASVVRELPNKSVVRITVSGFVSSDEFAEKQRIYEETLGSFMTYEVVDTELCERITPEKIRAEFAEIGFAAQLLEALDDPKEVQMAYEMIRKYRA